MLQARAVAIHFTQLVQETKMPSFKQPVVSTVLKRKEKAGRSCSPSGICSLLDSHSEWSNSVGVGVENRRRACVTSKARLVCFVIWQFILLERQLKLNESQHLIKIEAVEALKNSFRTVVSKFADICMHVQAERCIFDPPSSHRTSELSSSHTALEIPFP